MCGRRDLNRRPLLRFFIAKLLDLATNCLKIKAAVVEIQSSPRIRLHILFPGPHPRSSAEFS